jgi:AcrR family transcriptional regulator
MRDLARRQRLRAATEQEIREHTRSVLVERGREGLTLRAIAGELGMTAPALYRYFGSREELLRAVSSDICAELAAELHAAASPEEDGLSAVLAACRAFRRWALAHPREFGLVFGTSELGCPEEHAADCECGHAQFARAFLTVAARLILGNGLRTPSDDELPPDLVRGLTAYRHAVLDTFTATGLAVPTELVSVGAVYVFLQTWSRLYGQVALEVFGQLKFALDDAEPLFEAMLTDLTREYTGVSAVSDT